MNKRDGSADPHIRRTDLEAARNGLGVEIDIGRYHEVAHYCSLLISSFMIRHLTKLHRVFDGDLVAPIVLGEIAHHNVAGTFVRDGFLTQSGETVVKGRVPGPLRPCNVLSISEATGIPRESVRRRVDQFIRRGWIRRDDGGLVMTSKVAEEFVPDFNLTTLKDLLATAERLDKVLAAPRSEDGATAPVAAPVAPRAWSPQRARRSAA
ncbi:MAG: hypothetical protein U1E45_10450 [Geminicoccaceae bacterium]